MQARPHPGHSGRPRGARVSFPPRLGQARSARKYQLRHNVAVDIFVPPQVPGHDAHGIRRPSTRMLMGPCHAESGRKGPPATSHVCTGAQRHFPREPDRPAEPGRDRNRSGKTEHHNKKKEEKKEDQKQERKTQEKRTKTRRKEANTNTRNTTRARTQQQHPQTKTQDTRKNTMRVLHLAARKPP